MIFIGQYFKTFITWLVNLASFCWFFFFLHLLSFLLSPKNKTMVTLDTLDEEQKVTLSQYQVSLKACLLNILIFTCNRQLQKQKI